MNDKRILVVTGMHRSGTSVITRGLQVLGVSLGDRLMPPSPDNNEKGFWEDLDINGINVDLLHALGYDWQTLPLITEEEIKGSVVEQFKLHAVDVIRRKLAPVDSFGFKDPRIARLLPFWRDVFAHLDISVSYIIACRNPLSVGDSLARRDGYAPERTHELWLDYVLASLKHTMGQRRIVVDYDQLLDRPETELARIAHRLNLAFDPQGEEFKKYRSAFLDPLLRHSNRNAEDLRLNGSISPRVVSLYGVLSKLAVDAIGFDDRGFLSLVEEEYQQQIINRPLMQYVRNCEEGGASYAAQLQHQNQAVEELRAALLIKGNQLNDQNEQIGALNQVMVRHAARISELSVSLDEKKKAIAALNRTCNDQDRLIDDIRVQLESKRHEIAESGLRVAVLNRVLLERAAQVVDLGRKLHIERVQIEVLNKTNAEYSQRYEDLKASTAIQLQLLETKELEIVSLYNKLQEGVSQSASLSQALTDKARSLDEACIGLQMQQREIAVQKDKISELEQTLISRAAQVDSLNQMLLDKEKEIASIFSSKSWKITQPMRSMRRIIAKIPSITRRLISRTVRIGWRCLPLSGHAKFRLKSALFRSLPYAFSWTQVYKNWRNWSFQNPEHSTHESASYATSELHSLSADFIPLRRQGLKHVTKPAKLICFYLPQFHPIPENDEWWGKGFTAWTNVRPAKPQFSGHYQPRIPGELGYYNLLDKNVQQRQVELAEQYGIGGFCFYFYWFAGKRLLETPIKNWLENKALNLPFCLCWANENWTRRWDGLDSHVLIAQEYSAEDDIAFISYVAKYMRDERYISIDGKPLLIVYRPSLFPSAIETAQRWRTWCRKNGIGEIYLAYTQSFETIDPALYGFDAAIEFPPNNSSPPNVTGSVTPIKDDFGCNVFDWRIFVQRSQNYVDQGYQLFRSVCPSWDNTARRKNNSNIFINNSPEGFRTWLENAINAAVETERTPDNRLIFINAWNEWDEGAYMEPDQRYGYAYLEATYQALNAANERKQIAVTGKKGDFVPLGGKNIAVILHMYYPEMWPEIRSYLGNIEQPFTLYVSTTKHLEDEVRSMVIPHYPDAQLFAFDNRGRDIAPFLALLRTCNIAGYDYICKIHTKKSPHRVDGDQWRNDLLHKLLGNTEIVRANLSLLEQYSDVGVVGPEGHMVNYLTYWGSNRERVDAVSKRLGLNCEALDFEFVGGSMFWFKPKALQLLGSKEILQDNFEDEAGQLDGTLAHAIERLIPLFAYQAGYKTVASDFKGTYQNPRSIHDGTSSAVREQQRYRYVQQP